MENDTPNKLDELDTEQARQIDSICEQFESAWQSNELPRLENFLVATTDSLYGVLLHELIMLDMYYRKQAGESPHSSDYAERFPNLNATALDSAELTVPSKPARPEPKPGDTFGKYVLIEELGRGGMGIVYKARQLHPVRLVALKIIRADRLAPMSVEERARWLHKFRSEAQAVGALDHPNIVTLYEVGEEQEIPYFSMKYVEGKHLGMTIEQRMIRENQGIRADLRQAGQLVATVARAVHHAHQRGILHRDLKPANILLDLKDQPFVTDFGLSKRLDDELSHSSGFVGTPGFIPPEQAALAFAAPEQTVGRRLPAVSADVYGLGALLYILLTGHPPFQGKSGLDILLQVHEHEPKSPRSLKPEIDRDLETICLKCLRKEPDSRYGSAQALAEDLDNWLAGRPINARLAGPMERSYRWCRQNPVMAGLLGLVLSLLITIAVVSTIFAQNLSEALDTADKATQAESDAKAEALNKVWLANFSEANARRYSGRRGQRFESLRAIREALKLPLPPGHSLSELRNEAIAALCLPDVTRGPEWDTALQGEPTDPIFRPTIEFSKLWEKVPEPKAFPRRVAAYSNDIRFVLSCVPTPDGQNITPMNLWQRDGSTIRRVLFEPKVYNEVSAFRPDCMQVALAHPDRTIRLHETERGKEVQRLKVDDLPNFLAYHPKLPRLAIGAGREVVIFDCDGTLLKKLPHASEVTHIAWRPDGKQLATACNDYNIYLWDAETGRQLTPPWKGHRDLGIQLSFNLAGDRVTSNDYMAHFHLWDARSGRDLFQTPESYYYYNNVQPGLLGPFGDYKKQRLLSIAEGKELQQLYRITARNREAHFFPSHPDGRLHASSTPSGLSFFNLVNGDEMATVPIKDSFSLNFDDDGMMWTAFSNDAVYRWPVRFDGDTYDIGPPEWMVDFPTRSVFTCFRTDRSGRTFAIPQFSKGTQLVVRHEDGDQHLWLKPQYDVRFTHVSPDGRWVVTTSHWDDGKGVFAKIWEASTGRLVKELPIEKARFSYGFSPDGKWFAATSTWDGLAIEHRAENFYRLWEVGTWEEGGTIPTLGKIFWDRDLVIEGQRDGTMIMTQISTRKELARFTTSETGRIQPIALLKSGYLLARGDETAIVYMWDLPLIRSQLAEMGIDWEGPPFFPQAEMTQARTNYRVRIDAGRLGK